jgi:protein-disulfide isomerase-like protein with CxxC motif
MLSFQPGKEGTKGLDQTKKGSRKRESKLISNPSDKEKEEATVTMYTYKEERQMKEVDPLSKLQITVCSKAIFFLSSCLTVSNSVRSYQPEKTKPTMTKLDRSTAPQLITTHNGKIRLISSLHNIVSPRHNMDYSN